MTVNDRPVPELQVHPRDGKKFGMLAGRDTAELEWLATVLCRSLRLVMRPATEDRGPWSAGAGSCGGTPGTRQGPDGTTFWYCSTSAAFRPLPRKPTRAEPTPAGAPDHCLDTAVRFTFGQTFSCRSRAVMPETPLTRFVHPHSAYRLEYPAHWEHITQKDGGSCGFGPRERDNVGLWISIMPMSLDTDRFADELPHLMRRALPKFEATNVRRDPSLRHAGMVADVTKEGQGGQLLDRRRRRPRPLCQQPGPRRRAHIGTRPSSNSWPASRSPATRNSSSGKLADKVIGPAEEAPSGAVL